jgi:putative peptidoglycan lipid II flippase
MGEPPGSPRPTPLTRFAGRRFAPGTGVLDMAPRDTATTGGVPILAGVEKRASGRRLAWSTAIFSVATGISRVLGLVREIVAAYYFGATGKINAFTVAFQVPNLIRSLVADAALSSAFVPVFSELLEKGERKRAWRVASTLFWLLLLGLGAITALLIVFAPLVIAPFGDPGGDKQLAITLSRILFPIVVLLGVSGIIVGILNSYEHFTVPALTPVFWNLAIIVGLVLGVPRADSLDTKLYVYAISIVIGTVIQVLLPLPWLYGLDGRLRFALDWRDPAVRRVFVLMLPVTIGLGLINFNLVVNTLFASRFIDPELAPRAIDAAFRIYMLPQGMFSVAIATVLFPRLSRLAAREDVDGFRHTVALGVRQIAFTLVPASVFSAVLATPITRIVYERGAWTAENTTVTAGALAAFSLGLTFNGVMLMMNRAFFSLQTPWTPTVIAVGNLAVNTALAAALYHVGIWGIPLATSLANMTGAAALLIVFRRRLGRIEFGETARAALRITVASAALAAVAFPVWYVLDQALGRSVAAQVVSLGSAFVAGFAVYLFSCRLLGVRELNTLLSLRSRFRRG